MAFCFAHTTVETTTTCEDCKRPICSPCTEGTLAGMMCATCATRQRGRRTLRTNLKIGAVAAIVIGGGVVGLVAMTGGNKSDGSKVVAAPEEKDPYIDTLRKQRDKAPCDMAATLKLVQELNQMKRYPEALGDADAYWTKCGAFPRLKNDAIYALEQLGRFAEAIKHETELIADDPSSVSYWGWRGEDRGKTGEAGLALADYRQSIANSEGIGGSRFAASRILEVGRPSGRPCEAVAAIDYHVSFHGADLTASYERQLRALDLEASCAGKRGRGTFAFPPRGTEPTRVHVTVGGVAGTFLLEETCGTSAVTPDFAKRAQIALRAGPLVDTLAVGAVRVGPAATATLTIETATAPDTELAIVGGLPAGVDGVVGLNALWKFEMIRRDDGSLTIEGSGELAAN